MLQLPRFLLTGESVPNSRPLACCNLDISSSICSMISSVFMFPQEEYQRVIGLLALKQRNLEEV
jgi:hypothetical protein